MTTFGLILGGGGGLRLGGVNKSALRIGRNRLASLVVERLNNQVDKVAFSGSESLQNDHLPTDLPKLVDRFNPQIGPLGGIDAGYNWAKAQGGDDNLDRLLVAPVDTPFFPTRFVAMAEEYLPEFDVVAAKFGEQLYPTCSLWRLGAAKNISGTRTDAASNSIRGYFDSMNVKQLDFAGKYGENPFKNVNKISDLIGFGKDIA